jgi:peptidyl-prolyl cis-trans isomerase SurA
MNSAKPKFAGALLMGALVISATTSAQSLRLSNTLEPAAASAQVDGRTVDFIVALVNSVPVTNNEVRQRMLRVEQQMKSWRVR